jgi:hypothetical protein
VSRAGARPSGAGLGRALLRLSPTAILLLWLAGVARFRHYDLSVREWAVVVACAFALHVLSNRLLRPRPLGPLPAGSSPGTLAALAAAILALPVTLIAGVFEWVIEPVRPSEVSWFLRTLWHTACSFGASYCGFLGRLQRARPAAG